MDQVGNHAWLDFTEENIETNRGISNEIECTHSRSSLVCTASLPSLTNGVGGRGAVSR